MADQKPETLKDQLAAAVRSGDTAKVLALMGGAKVAPPKLPKVNIEDFRLSAREHTWKSGTRGYIAVGKVDFNGKRYQVNVNLFEVGSKNPAEDAAGA